MVIKIETFGGKMRKLNKKAKLVAIISVPLILAVSNYAFANSISNFYAPRTELETNPKWAGFQREYERKDAGFLEKAHERKGDSLLNFTYRGLLDAKMVLGKYQEVYDIADREIPWVKSGVYCQCDSTKIQWELLHYRAVAQLKMEKYDGAFADLMALFGGIYNFGAEFYDVPEMQGLMKQLQQASDGIDKSHIDKDAKIHPDAYAAYVTAVNKSQTMDKASALAAADTAVKLSPDLPEYLNLRARIKASMHDNVGWLEDAKKSLEMYQSANNGFYLSQYGLALMANGRIEEAKATLHKATNAGFYNPEFEHQYTISTRALEAKNNPKAFALYISGTKKMENNDLNGAYNDANAAIALSPNFGEYYNLRGRATLAYLKAGKEVPVGNADIDKDLFKGQDLDGYKMQPRRDLSEFYAAIANGTYDNKYVARYDRGSFGSAARKQLFTYLTYIHNDEPLSKTYKSFHDADWNATLDSYAKRVENARNDNPPTYGLRDAIADGISGATNDVAERRKREWEACEASRNKAPVTNSGGQNNCDYLK